MRLSKDDILKIAGNVAPEEVDVPEWNGTVLVRGMTGKERDAFEVSLLQPGRGGRREMNPANARAKVVARCVVDEDGNRVFTDGDANELGDLPAGGLDRVYGVAARLSGMGDGDQEDAVRDFALADGGGSSSSSRPGSARQPKGS